MSGFLGKTVVKKFDPRGSAMGEKEGSRWPSPPEWRAEGSVAMRKDRRWGNAEQRHGHARMAGRRRWVRIGRA
jgi:hypothetical protein